MTSMAAPPAPRKRSSWKKIQSHDDVFQGRVLTGTDWFEHHYTGKRVALLAMGAEAADILPELLHTAAAVILFEEAPTWITPVKVPFGPLRRLAARAYLRLAVDDPWTRRQLTPHKKFDSPAAKVSPSYYSALQDPRVRLVHWPAYALAPRGVRAADGVEYRVDIVVIGATSKFADPASSPKVSTP